MLAHWRQNTGIMQKFCKETVEIDFIFTKKVNYKALGMRLLFTTSNKKPTLDSGSGLAQRLRFLLFQFCSWIDIDMERGHGGSHLLSVTCLRKVVSPAPILPTVPAKWTLGNAARPRDGARWGHSPLWPGNHWKWGQPLTVRALWAPRIIPNAKHSLGFYWNL